MCGQVRYLLTCNPSDVICFVFFFWTGPTEIEGCCGANDHLHFKRFITAEGGADHYESWIHGKGMMASDGLTIGKFVGRGGANAYIASGEAGGY